MSILTRETYLILILSMLQFVFWYGIPVSINDDGTNIWRGSRSVKPDLSVVPEVHSDIMVDTLSLGDKQFYFRVMGYMIQNAGDSFGRSTPLRDYDYAELYKWWMIFDRIDPVSNFIPSLVSYYYGASQDVEGHLPYVVKYLEQHSNRDPSAKWWWYTQAIYHAKHRLGDYESGLRMAQKLYEVPYDIDMPVWARQMKAFLLEDRGEYVESCEIVLDILDSYEGLREGELNFIQHFITERLNAMKGAKDDPELNPRCKKILEFQEEIERRKSKLSKDLLL